MPTTRSTKLVFTCLPRQPRAPGGPPTLTVFVTPMYGAPQPTTYAWDCEGLGVDIVNWIRGQLIH